MSIYKGQFSNIKGEVYNVTIDAHRISDSEEKSIVFADTPCVIETSSGSIFEPIKSRSCTIQILTNEWLFDLYSPVSQGVKVTIKKGLKTVFFGYLTPNSYDQTYTYLDDLSLEAVDAVSSLKDFKYSPIGGSIPSYEKVSEIILNLLRNAGYSGMLYVPATLQGMNGESKTNTFEELQISEGNFFDDDEEHTPWYQYEVLEEIMRFLGWSLCPFGDDVYLIDYRVIGNNSSTVFHKYEISTGTQSEDVDLTNQMTITKSDYAPGEPSLSMDDVFNKIEISDNLYEVEEIAPDIFDENSHISINDEKNLSVSGTKWVKTSITKHWLIPDEVSREVTGYDYQTICRIKPDTNWTHHFYRMSSLGSNPVEVVNENGLNYYDGDINSEYVNNVINKYMNTHGCLLQHYAYMPKTANLLPTSVDWEDLLTFFLVNDKVNTNGQIDYTTFKNLRLPVLEYTVPEEVMFKPSSGKSWIGIKGDLFYQFNDAKYGDKSENTLNIVNTTDKIYATAPVEKSSEVEEQPFPLTEREYRNGETYYDFWGNILANLSDYLGEYGSGYKMWQMKLQIGDKYWNGERWTSTESTFFLSYNNGPDGDKEYLPLYSWCKLVPNIDYRDKVGEDIYAIPIDSEDPDAPTHGQMKLTIYTPNFFPEEVFDLFRALIENGTSTTGFTTTNWYDIPPVIFAKDFEINYYYTDSFDWYSQHKSNEANSRDVVYTNVINDNYVNEFDSLELKINTQQKDKPISRSYITSGDGYVGSIKHVLGDEYKEQEKNLIDLYYEHYSSPKRKYTCNIGDLKEPYTKVAVSAIGGKYVIDSQSYDLKLSNNTTTLIEY